MLVKVQSIFVLCFCEMFIMQLVRGCDQKQVFTLDMIQNTGANILTDPVGVAKTFQNLVCATPCTHIEKSFQVSRAAFELAIIDLQLEFLQIETDFGAIFLEHIPNTNPILTSTILIFVNSFLQAFLKYNYFSCESLLFVNNAFDKAIPMIHDHISDAQSTIWALEACAKENHVYIKDDVSMMYEICVRKVVNNFTVDFNNYLAHLAKYKYFFPNLVVQFANCLIKYESNLDLKTALETSDCIGLGESERFPMFYYLLNEGLIEMVDVARKLVTTVTNIQNCGSYFEEKLYEAISKENVNCNLINICD